MMDFEYTAFFSAIVGAGRKAWRHSARDKRTVLKIPAQFKEACSPANYCQVHQRKSSSEVEGSVVIFQNLLTRHRANVGGSNT